MEKIEVNKEEQRIESIVIRLRAYIIKANKLNEERKAKKEADTEGELEIGS